MPRTPTATPHRTVIGVSGAIATGKTTFVTKLGKALGDATVATEDVSANPYLADFYQDMKQWAFHSRMAMLTMKLASLIEAESSTQFLVLDRPVHELGTFASLHLELGVLAQRDFDTFTHLHRLLLHLAGSLDCIVHVHCSPKVALERIALRGREFERNIDISYLERIPPHYERWLSTRPAPNIFDVNSGIEPLDTAAERVAAAIQDLRAERVKRTPS